MITVISLWLLVGLGLTWLFGGIARYGRDGVPSDGLQRISDKDVDELMDRLL